MIDQPTTVIVAQAVAGSPDGVEALVARWSPWLLVQARLRLRGRLGALCEPEDLVQDVWLRVLPRLSSLDLAGRRRTPALVRYLTTALSRRVRDLIGRASRRLAGPAPAMPEVSASAELTGSVGGVLSRAVVRERAEQVWDAVSRLSVREQELVMLRGIERAPYQEIGAVLGISPSAAASAWRRVRERLAIRLDSGES